MDFRNFSGQFPGFQAKNQFPQDFWEHRRIYLNPSPEAEPVIETQLDRWEREYNIDLNKTVKKYFTDKQDNGPNNINTWFPGGNRIALDKINAALAAIWVSKEAGVNKAGNLTAADQEFIEFLARQIEKHREAGKQSTKVEREKNQKDRFEEHYNIDMQKTAQEYYWTGQDQGAQKVANWFQGTSLDWPMVNGVLGSVWQAKTVGRSKKGALTAEDTEFIEFLASEITAYGPQFREHVSERIELEQKGMTDQAKEYQSELRLAWKKIQQYFSGPNNAFALPGVDLSSYSLGFTATEWSSFEFTDTTEPKAEDFEKISRLLSAVEAEIRKKQTEIVKKNFSARSEVELREDVKRLKEVAAYLGGPYGDWGGLLGFLRIRQKAKVLEEYLPVNALPKSAADITEKIEELETRRDALQTEKEAFMAERRKEQAKSLPRPDYAKVADLEYKISEREYQVNLLSAQISSLNVALGIRTFDLEDDREGVMATMKDIVTEESKEKRNEATRKLLEKWEQEKAIDFAATVNTYFEEHLDEANSAADSVETWFDEQKRPNMKAIYETLAQCWVAPGRKNMELVLHGEQIVIQDKGLSGQAITVDAGDKLFLETLASHIRMARNLRQQGNIGGIQAEEYEAKEDVIEQTIEGFKDALTSGDPVAVGSAAILLFVGFKSLFSGDQDKGVGKYLKWGIFAVAAHKFVKETYGFDVLQTLRMQTPENLFQGTYFQAQIDIFDRNRENLEIDPASRMHMAIESRYYRSLLLKEMNDTEMSKLIAWHQDAYPNLLTNADTQENRTILFRNMPGGVRNALANIQGSESREPSDWELALIGLGTLELYFTNVAFENGDNTPDIITGRNFVESTYLPDLAQRKGKTSEEILLGELFQDMIDAHELHVSTDLEKTLWDRGKVGIVRLWKEAGLPLMKQAYNWTEEKFKKFAEKLEEDWGPEIFQFVGYLKQKGLDVAEIVTDKIVIWYHGHKVEIRKAATGFVSIFVDSLKLSVEPIVWVGKEVGKFGNSHLIPDVAHRVVAEVEQHVQERATTSESVLDTGVTSGSTF